MVTPTRVSQHKLQQESAIDFDAVAKDFPHILDMTAHSPMGRLLDREANLALGRAQRKQVSRQVLTEISPRPRNFNLLSVYRASNIGRLPALMPVRARRMSISPFTFFRGLPLAMAMDLGREPHSGLFLQICGDCHLLNFGGFASPERHLLFGINDFDETIVGPFEWDLKRLATSFVIAAREISLSANEAQQAVRIVMESYRDYLQQMTNFSPLEVWYQSVDAKDVLAATESRKTRKIRATKMTEARHNTSKAVVPKWTEVNGDGKRKFIDEPPLIFHPKEGDPFAAGVRPFFERYRESLPEDRQTLFDRYRLTDIAIKVVGVGSVGTRCAVAMFESADSEKNGTEPLILQMKEARRSVLADFVPVHYANQGARVVHGQHMMQAASDIFLGWASSGRVKTNYYVRQLRDMKMSIDIEEMDGTYLMEYAKSCGMALAHAHGKAGNPAVITGYLGKSDRFIETMQHYAVAYADRNEADYAVFMKAVAAGKIKRSD